MSEPIKQFSSERARLSYEQFLKDDAAEQKMKIDKVAAPLVKANADLARQLAKEIERNLQIFWSRDFKKLTSLKPSDFKVGIDANLELEKSSTENPPNESEAWIECQEFIKELSYNGLQLSDGGLGRTLYLLRTMKTYFDRKIRLNAENYLACYNRLVALNAFAHGEVKQCTPVPRLVEESVTPVEPIETTSQAEPCNASHFFPPPKFSFL